MSSTTRARDAAERLVRAGEPDEALALLRSARLDAPHDVDLLRSCTVVLERLGRIDEAVALVSGLAEELPTPDGHIELARLEAGRRDRTARDAALARALERFPARSDVYRCLADAADDDGDLERAQAMLERTLEIDPTDDNACTKLAGVCIESGRPDLGLAYLARARRLKPRESLYWKAPLFPLHYVDGSREACFEAHRRWASRCARVSKPLSYAPIARPTGRRLRVGYLSPDLRDHAVMRFLGRVLVEHDRDAFEIHAYSCSRHPLDQVTANIRALPLHFHEVQDLLLPDLAARIVADRIDVLVDLAGHTDAGRVEVCAYRPAPVQLTWLGYPDTTGLDEVDGRITDAVADPTGAEAFHTERLLRLPCCAWNYASVDAPVEPYVPQSVPTFGSFNGLPKASPRTLDVWAKLLKRVPDARLLLSSRRVPKSFQDAWLERSFGSRGVDPGRVSFRAYRPGRAGHLASHAELDVALDPFPYNGTTSTCDALWMGVPVVTLEGDRHVSRVATSLLRHLGLDELVAQNEDEYVDIAAELVRNPVRLAELRRTLRPSMGSTTIGDARRFTRELEALYRREVERAYEEQSAGTRPAPGERLHHLDCGTISTSDALSDPDGWAMVEHQGADEVDARLLAALARNANGVEVGVSPGVLTLSMAKTAKTLRTYCPDGRVSAHLARSLHLSGLHAPRVELLQRLPERGAFTAADWIRLEPVAPPSFLLGDLTRLDVDAEARPLVIARASVRPFVVELDALLLARGYLRFTHALGFDCLAPVGAPPTIADAHVFYVPRERARALAERDLLEAELPASVTLDDASAASWDETWAGLGYVGAFGIADATLPSSVRLELIARDRTRPRAVRIAARRDALSSALDELSCDDHPLVRLTAARLLLEHGRPGEAADVLGPLTEMRDWSAVRLDRGFLPVSELYEASSEVTLPAWLEGQVLSGFVHAAAPSGFYQPDSVLELLGRVEALGMSTPRDDMRFGLCLARANAS